MLTLIRETLIDETGFLKLYFTPEWEHISYADSTEEVRNMNLYYDHVSFGHDVETAYLMLEASHTINNEYDMKTLLTAKRMVDHALANGWDNEKGGFYEMGYYYKNVDSISLLNDSKIWWCQAEGLNSLLMMAILFDEADYLQKFQKQWQYINTYLIDHVHGEWYFEGMDSCPETVTKPKTSMWKVNYHNSRALMNCICMLENKPL
jgi:mannobiose 2-epimerase